jgi:hypothetical protein
MLPWGLRFIPLALVALLLGEFFVASRPHRGPSLLPALTEQLRFAYHECVPLGWKPMAVSGTYYPGYTASMTNYAEWDDAVWRGHIAAAELHTADAAEVFQVLNHLRAAGLLTRTYKRGGYDFYLTPRAFAYFYGSSQFKDNRGSMTYLCYSTIAPQRIVWQRPIAPPQMRRRSPVQWYHVEFAWRPSPAAAWAARDPFLRFHSVVLAPLTSPTEARVYYEDGDWYVANVYDRGWMMPALVTGLGRTPR